MLFSAIGPNGKFSLPGSETKSYFPAPVTTSQNCLSQKIVNGESVKLIRRSISGRNSISTSKTVASSQKTTTTTLKKDMDVNASPLIKAISGRINLGTEYLKETVQKVFNIANDNNDKNLMHLKSSTNLSPKNITKSSLNLHHVNNISSTLKNDSRAYKQPLHFKENCEKQNTSAKGFTLPPSIFHRQVEAYRTAECSSVDNLNKEMCHFRPIRLAPISPWKSGINLPRRGVIVVPKTVIGRTNNVAGDNAFASIMNEEEMSTRRSLFSPPHKSAFVSTKPVHHVEIKEKQSRRTKKSVKPVAKSTRKSRRANVEQIKNIRAKEIEITVKTKLRSRDPKVANKKLKSPKLITEKKLKNNHGTAQRGQKKSLNAQILNKKKKNKLSSQNIGQSSCSPPLTRSRVREMGKSNLTNALQYLGRYI